MNEVLHLFPIPDHQCGPVVATFECKICATGPIVSDRPQNYGPVLLIECIAHVNRDKTPVVLLQVLLPHKPHHVDSPLYIYFQTPEELLLPVGLFGLFSNHCKYALSEESLPGITNPNRSHIGILVCHYQTDLLQGPIR